MRTCSRQVLGICLVALAVAPGCGESTVMLINKTTIDGRDAAAPAPRGPGRTRPTPGPGG